MRPERPENHEAERTHDDDPTQPAVIVDAINEGHRRNSYVNVTNIYLGRAESRYVKDGTAG